MNIHTRWREPEMDQACIGWAQTEGVLLSDLDTGDLAALDAYEEVPTLYTREEIEVRQMDGTQVRCWVYLPTTWADPFVR